MSLHPGLDAIDLVVFDKDGTLISFEAMWGGWARRLAARTAITAIVRHASPSNAPTTTSLG